MSQVSSAGRMASLRIIGRRAGGSRLGGVSLCRLLSTRPWPLEKQNAPNDYKSKRLRIKQQSEELQPKPVSPSEVTYTGGAVMPITSQLELFKNEVPSGTWPVFRLMDESGHFRDAAMDGYKSSKTRRDDSRQDDSTTVPTEYPTEATDRHDINTLRTRLQQEYPHFSPYLQHHPLLQSAETPYADTLSQNPLLRAYRHMVRLVQMDKILQNAQRQGRISFYMTCRGEEAIHIGTSSALEMGDTVFAQYREAGILMWRGFTLDQFCNQCFANESDLGRGRQMPVHYGCRALNYHTVSSPLGTQLPQAVGAAYFLKKQDDKVAVCFFGDGCASTTDFHSALNFAATLKVPCIFVCRNNGYAISTPVTDQYAGDGIVCRALGYGMAGVRVDGNDVFAVSAAMKEAKRYALEQQAPVLMECMTYRQGHHSTSDDSTRYRSSKEVKDVAVYQDPLQRLKHFMELHKWQNAKEASAVRDEEKMAVLKAMEQAERKPKPKLQYLFEDVYQELPPHLLRQQKELNAHIAKYPNRY